MKIIEGLRRGGAPRERNAFKMFKNDWIQEMLRVNDEKVKLSEKQARVLEAAIEIFSEKGYAATTTSEIAKAAGVAEGTIFKHYKTKKELFLSIVVPTLSKVVGPFLARNFVKEVFENEYLTYEEFIKAIILNRNDFIKKNLPLLRIFLQEIAFHPELKQSYQEVFSKHVYTQVERIIEHFKAKGQIVQIPSPTVLRFTMSTVMGFLLTRHLIMPDKEWDDEQEIENTIFLLMHGLARS